MMSGSEAPATQGRIPSAIGDQPTLAMDMRLLQVRITSTKHGSITQVQVIDVPAQLTIQLTQLQLHLLLTLMQQLYQVDKQLIGIYPAMDLFDSNSQILYPMIVVDKHYKVARNVQSLGMDELLEEDKKVLSKHSSQHGRYLFSILVLDSSVFSSFSNLKQDRPKRSFGASNAVAYQRTFAQWLEIMVYYALSNIPKRSF
ncbi:unnamed protein product [Paramecium sonneborni]|uniref:Uncharacterized protein n=1 Tax=Paramecium sonneborni TaxID=65129 RepID=A0A8S1RJX9_9CILI|nr:unnamed protein product [Paramecium sonneborni]